MKGIHAKRDVIIAETYLKGVTTFNLLSIRWGLSGNRIRQIVLKHALRKGISIFRSGDKMTRTIPIAEIKAQYLALSA